MATRIPESKHTTSRSLITGNKHKAPPSNKRQALPLGVSITWEHIETNPTPAMRLCIIDKSTRKRIKLGRGLVRNGIGHACFQIRNTMLLNDYEVSSLQVLADQVKAVLVKEAVGYGFDPDWIIDFYFKEYLL